MSSRKPGRRRRERGSTLPRPSGGQKDPLSAASSARPSAVTKRERHTTSDYSYVRRDLVGVAATAAVTVAFVAAMAFVL